MKLKKLLSAFVIACSGAALLSACTQGGTQSTEAKKESSPEETEAPKESEKAETEKAEGGKRLNIVCTNFPEYDFVRAIAKDQADITMLLKPGAESHSYEPTPEDIIKIQKSDLFLYVGGDSDEWVAGMLKSMDTKNMTIFKLMDAVDLIEEGHSEGMEPEKEEEEPAAEKSAASEGESASEKSASEEAESEEEEGPEMDEHVWTSPVNAEKIVEKLAETMEKLDPEKKESFSKNAEDYIGKLKKLDQEFRDVVNSGKRKEIIVADRFPFTYFCKEYGLSYYAAFPGCSTDTQPSAKTIAFLQDKVKEDQIPVVFHIELSNEQMADAICKDTGAKKELLNAIHNVTDEDFKAGVTYVDLMEKNVPALKEALN